MATTRHGLYGGARQPYGSFAGKEEAVTIYTAATSRVHVLEYRPVLDLRYRPVERIDWRPVED